MRWRHLWAVLGLAWSLGCGISSHRTANRALRPTELAERLALGAIDGAAGGDPVQSARRHAEFARDSGQRAAAIETAFLYLARANVHARLSQRNADSRTVRAAQVQLRDAVDWALKIGEREDAPDLVIEAALLDAKPRRHRKAIAAAATRVSWLAERLVGPAMELVESDPVAWLALRRLRMSPWSSPKLGDDLLGDPVPAAALSSFDANVRDFRWDRIETAARSGTLGQAAWGDMEWIAEHDPSDVVAAAMLVVRAELRAGTLIEDPMLWSDTVGLSEAPGAVARGIRREEASSQTSTPRLLRALSAWRVGLYGDVLELLDDSTFKATSPASKEVATGLRAMALLAAASPNSFERWTGSIVDAGAIPVRAWMFAASFDDSSDPATASASRRAQRDWVAWDPRSTRASVLARVILDPKTRPRSARRASSALRQRAPRRWRAFELCPEVSSELEPCRTFFDDSAEDYGVDLGFVARRAPEHRSLDAGWLSAHRWSHALLFDLADSLPRFDATTLALDAVYQELAVRSLLAAGRHPEAARRLEAVGRMLPMGVLVDLTLAVREPKGDAPDQISVWLGPLERPKEVGGAASTAATGPRPEALTDRVAFARDLSAGGQWQDAATEWSGLASEFEGRVRVAFAARAAIAAAAAGNGAVADEMARAVSEALPGGAEDRWVQGVRALEAGDRDAARAAFETVLSIDPSSGAAWLAMLETTAHDTPGRPPVLLAELAPSVIALDPSIPRAMQQAGAQPIDSHALLVALNDQEKAWGLGERALPHSALVFDAIQYVHARIRDADDSAEAVRWAARGADYLASVPSPLRWRDRRLRLLLLADRAAEGLTLARFDLPEEGIEPVPPSDDIVLLLESRAKDSIDDSLTRTFFEWLDTGAHADAVAAFTREPPDRGPLLAFSCGQLVARDELDKAADICARAWARPSAPWRVAVDYAYVLLEGSNAKPEAALGFFTAKRLTQRWDPRAALDPDRRFIGLAMQDHALFKERMGDAAAAASLWTDAYALSDDTFENQIEQTALSTFALRGSLARTLVLQGANGTNAPLARYALMDGAVVAARAYAGQTRTASREASSAQRRQDADRALHLAEILEDDLRREQLPTAVRPHVVALALGVEDLEQLEKLRATHPESGVVSFAMAGAYLNAERWSDAEPLVTGLSRTFPKNPWVAVRSARLRVGLGQTQEAKRMFADARAAHPDADIIQHSSLPTSITGAPTTRVAWMRTPKAFRTRLGKVATDAMVRVGPRYRSHTSVAADGFFPVSYDRHDDAPLTYTDSSGQTLAIVSQARASRCEAEECLQTFVAEMKRDGYRVVWTADAKLPGGSGAEALLVNGRGWASVVAVPAGGRVFGLFALTRWEDSERLLPAVALLRRTFSALDRIVDAGASAELRVDGRAVDDLTRLRARLERRRSRVGCPLGDTFRSAEGPVAAELLLDSYLAAPNKSVRRRLTRCAAPHSRAARRIALLALLDPDATIHGFGREATQAHGLGAAVDFLRLATTLEKPPTSSSVALSDEWTPHGWLELLTNLPHRTGRSGMARLLRSPHATRRLTAWTAASIRPELVDPKTAANAVRNASPAEAAQALDALSNVDPHAAALAARDRLELEPIETRASSTLVRALTRVAARELDTADTDRIRRAATRIEADTQWARTDRTRLTTLADAHARAVDLARRGVEHAEDDPVADALLQDSRQALEGKAKPKTATALRTLGLAELLDGPDWVFARVANPGLFASTATGVLARIEPDDPMHQILFDRLIDRARVDSGLSTLEEGAGLDLSAPIECASPANAAGFVCTATVKDRDALLSTLEKRRYGVDAGVGLPLRIAMTAGAVPLALSTAPLLFEQFTFDDDDDDDEPPAPAPETSTTRIQSQRVRFERRLHGHDVEFYATTRSTAGRVSVDAERYLFIGNRVVVMSSSSVADRVLTVSGETSLHDQPAFRTLTAGWKDGSALQAVALGRASLLPDADAAIETVIDETGLRFRYAATTSAKVSDISTTEARLPEGAVSKIALGLGTFEERWSADRPRAKAAPTDVALPFELMTSSPASAFGWYPRPKDSVWQRWVAVLERSDKSDAVAKRLGIRLRTTPNENANGLHAAVDGNLLILSSDPALLDRAREAKDRASTKGATVVLARGSFEGKPAAALLAELPTTTPNQRSGLRLIADFVGLIEDVNYEAVWDPKTKLGVLEGRVSLRLAEASQASDVVDRWLASAPLRNATSLPRRLGSDELDRPLRFRFRVPDSESFTRSVLDSQRVTVNVLDATHVELTVAPQPPRTTQTPLDKKARARALRSTGLLQSKAPTIRDQAAALVPEGASPKDAATAVTNWVHGRLHYEVTPRSISATQILRRGRGDCSEYAALTVSLLRAAGVPAEIRSGMAASEKEVVAHAWVAYHDGDRWHEVDPTFGRMSVTSGHLPLSVVDLLALLSLGRLEIEAIDRAP